MGLMFSRAFSLPLLLFFALNHTPIIFFLDLDIEPWVEDGDKKKRAVKYTINLGLTIGPKTSRIQENQVSAN